VVVDRRVVLEEEERSARDRRYADLKEGETLTGTVPQSYRLWARLSILGGVDAFANMVGDISWSRINKAADRGSRRGRQVEVKSAQDHERVWQGAKFPSG